MEYATLNIHHSPFYQKSTRKIEITMQVTAEQTDPCTIVLDIVVDEQQVTRVFDSVYREFSKFANVPGFRPGKAPRALLERYINQDKVRERAQEKLLQDTYPKAVQEQGINPFRQGSVEASDIEDKKPFAYKAFVPLEPKITVGPYTGLTVERPVFPVTDETIEDRLNKLREDRAKMERISDRGVQAGDMMIIESQVVLEGEDNPPSARRQLAQWGNSVPGFDEAVTGMMAGEERTFELTYPEDYEEEARRGKKATFHVKLISISAKRLPELTDEFAKQVAGVDTVDDLKNAIRTRLETDSTELSNQLAEQRLIQQIVEGSEVHFPEALVREEVEQQYRQLATELQQRGMTYEQFLSQYEMTAEQHQQSITEDARERIRSVLALRIVAEQEGLQATNELVDEEFDRLLTEGKITEDQYEEFRPDERRRFQIANALVQTRLHDYLFAHNTITDVIQDTPADPDDLAEAAEAAEESVTE